MIADAPLDLDLLAVEPSLKLVFDGLENEEQTAVLFVLTRGGEVELSMNHDGLGEVWAEPYAEFVDDEGIVTRVSSLEVELASQPFADVMWELDEEVIEGQLFLCDQVVDNRSDSGPGSLREGVARVRNGGMVCFDPAEFNEPGQGKVELGEEIGTTKDLTIRGVAGASIVSADGQGRAFRFEGDTTVRRLTIENGSADDGGLVHAVGPLRLQGVTLRQGAASARGGALAHFGPAAVTLEHVDILQSHAGLLGGGAYIEGPTDAYSVRIADNTAGFAGGGMHVDELDSDGLRLSTNEALEGGGMWIGSGFLRGLDVSTNRARRGGGLAVAGSVNAQSPKIYNNVAESAVAIAQGGGAYVAPNATLLLAGSAPASSGVPASVGRNRADEGGGIAIATGGQLQLLGNARVDTNAAARGGGILVTDGHVYVLDDSEIVNNTAVEDHGGGVLLRNGSIDLAYDARIHSNEAKRYGGGVYMDPGYAPSSLGFPVIDGPNGARIEHNDANYGGGVYQWGGIFGASVGVHIAANTPENIVQH